MLQPGGTTSGFRSSGAVGERTIETRRAAPVLATMRGAVNTTVTITQRNARSFCCELNDDHLTSWQMPPEGNNDPPWRAGIQHATKRPQGHEKATGQRRQKVDKMSGKHKATQTTTRMGPWTLMALSLLALVAAVGILITILR